MSDYDNVNEQISKFATSKQIEDLNNTIIELRKYVVYLESKIAEYEKVPIPRSVIEQILKLENKIKKQEGDLNFYKKHVAPHIIINRENKNKPTRRGGVPK